MSTTHPRTASKSSRIVHLKAGLELSALASDVLTTEYQGSAYISHEVQKSPNHYIAGNIIGVYCRENKVDDRAIPGEEESAFGDSEARRPYAAHFERQRQEVIIRI